MTDLYRETIALDRPAPLAERDLRDRFGPPEDGTVWRVTRPGYRYRVALDRTAGTVTVTVSGVAWFRWLLGVALVGTLVALAVPLPPVALFGLLWGSSALALYPVGPLWPGTPFAVPTRGLGETVSERLTGYSLPAYGCVVGVLWTVVRPAGGTLVADALAATLVLVGAGVHYAGNSVRGSRHGTVTTFGLPLSGLLPGLVVGANLLLLDTLSPGDGARTVLAVIGALVLFDGLFFTYCLVALRSFRTSRLAPLRSTVARVAAFGLFLGVNCVLVVTALVGLRLLWLGIAPATPPDSLVGLTPAYSALDAVFAAVPFVPARVLSVSVHLLALGPILYVAVGWVYAVGVGTLARWAALLRSAPLSVAIPTTIPVRVAALGAPVVRPVSLALGRWPFVIVAEETTALLATDELAAVVAHEAHHLEGRDLLAGAVAAVAGLAVGGRNAVLAFYDYHAAERAADAHAARVTSSGAVIRAIRRLEDAHARRSVSLADAPVRHVATSGRLSTVALAPYHLLFGTVLLDAAHASTDERVARLATLDETDDATETKPR
jgi:Zn-dependent protease with chaperone function